MMSVADTANNNSMRRPTSSAQEHQSSSLSTSYTLLSSSSSLLCRVERNRTIIVHFSEEFKVHVMTQHTKQQRAAMYYNESEKYRMKLDTANTVQTLQETPETQEWINEDGVVTSDHDDLMWATYGKCIRGLESVLTKAHYEKRAAKQRLHAQVLLKAQQLHKDSGTTATDACEARLARLAQFMSRNPLRIAQTRAMADEEAAKNAYKNAVS